MFNSSRSGIAGLSGWSPGHVSHGEQVVDDSSDAGEHVDEDRKDEDEDGESVNVSESDLKT